MIASDKTGTLTRNEMTVREVVTASRHVDFSGTGYAPAGDVKQDGNGPVAGTLRIELERALAGEVPFSSERKLMSTLPRTTRSPAVPCERWVSPTVLPSTAALR